MAAQARRLTREQHLIEFEQDWFRVVPVRKATIQDVAQVTRYPVKTIRNYNANGELVAEGDGPNKRFDLYDVEMWVWEKKTGKKAKAKTGTGKSVMSRYSS